MHINLSLSKPHTESARDSFMAGLMDHICEITAFLNPLEASYARLGECKAPRYVTWSPENRSQLIRIPAAKGEFERIELRSPDPAGNPYLSFSLILAAGLDGIRRGLVPPPPTNLNLFTADESVTRALRQLPRSRAEAAALAKDSAYVRSLLPAGIIDACTGGIDYSVPGGNGLADSDAKQNSVLVVSGSERTRATLAGVFDSTRYAPVITRGSAAEVRRLVLDSPFSLVFINTPLPDEPGTQLALDLSSNRSCCVALLVSGDNYDQINDQVEDAGVLTLSKPCSAQQLRQAAAMMSATRVKLADLEKKTATLEEKMEEVRLVNRAKWMLIERRGMDEATAHRYIEKLAMDARQTRRLVAQTLIRSLDND